MFAEQLCQTALDSYLSNDPKSQVSLRIAGGTMRFPTKDALWLMLLIALGLGWWLHSDRQANLAAHLERRLEDAESREATNERHAELAASECDVMVEEVRRMRGLLKSSIADKRDWFELEVAGNRLIAIRPATSESRVLTLQTVEQIESATGLVATRLRHFLTPISEQQLKPR